MPAQLRAGTAKSDITTDAPGAVINDPLYAKALVLDDGTTTLVLLAMDVTAIGGIGEVSDDFLPQLRARLESELAIPGGNVLVNASHTHPPGSILCSHEEQLARTFDAVRRAKENLTPAKLGVGVGREDRFIINRTLRLKDGKHWTIRHANPCPPDDEVAELGPLDPEIGLLRVDRLDGTPLAVVYNFACHALLGIPGGAITANFSGGASAVIEECLGPDCLALFLQGAGGDVCEVLYKDPNRPRDCRQVGPMLGISVLEALKGVETSGATLKVVSETVRLPRRTDVPDRIATLRAEQEQLLASLRFTSLNFRSFLPLYIRYALNPEYPADYSYRYLQADAIGETDLKGMDAENRGNLDKYLSNIRAMERLARIQDDIGTLLKHKADNDASGEDTIAAEIMAMKIGDFVLITAPIEVLTQVGMNVKNASPHKHAFMSAFTNGYMHYGPPAEDYDKQGYEVTECLLGAGWQETYEKKAAELLARL